MATKKQSESVEALVLCDCGFGKVGEVVTIALTDAEVGAANGMLDLHIDAVQAAQDK
jgi:hypothetical protein